MYSSLAFLARILLLFYCSLSVSVGSAQETVFTTDKPSKRRGYLKGDLIPVSCLNRTIDTGEHITDSHGNLQYIPFPVCNETSLPLSFEYLTPKTQICTIDLLPDELYHLIEFFVHSDVPLTCRVPSYPLEGNTFDTTLSQQSNPETERDGEALQSTNPWTPFTIALQGTLQLSHLHLHTNINVLFHTSAALTTNSKTTSDQTHIIASTAYSLPISASTNSTDPSEADSSFSQSTLDLDPEGTKILRNAPLTLTFNVAWIDGPILPGAPGRPLASSIVNHGLGLSLLSVSALAASAGVGAMAMLIYERRSARGKRVSGMNGLLGGNVGRITGFSHGGYGGYTSTGKRD